MKRMKHMRYTRYTRYRMDRFEGAFAILEYDDPTQESGVNFISVLRSGLPGDLREGVILEFTGTDWKLCRDETDSRRQALAERRRRMLQKRQKN